MPRTKKPRLAPGTEARRLVAPTLVHRTEAQARYKEGIVMWKQGKHLLFYPADHPELPEWVTKRIFTPGPSPTDQHDEPVLTMSPMLKQDLANCVMELKGYVGRTVVELEVPAGIGDPVGDPPPPPRVPVWLPRQLAHLAHCAADADAGRYAMASVRLRVWGRGRHFRAEVTDGRKIVAVTADSNPPLRSTSLAETMLRGQPAGGGDVLVPVDWWQKVLSDIKGDPFKLDQVPFKIHSKGIAAATAGALFRTQQMEGRYPPTDTIFKDMKIHAHEIHIGVEQLVDILRTAMGLGLERLTLSLPVQHGPLYIHGECKKDPGDSRGWGKMEVALMPLT